jgi:hypothetical protein
MWPLHRISRRAVRRVQPHVEDPLVALATFGWVVTWHSPRHPETHPELAAGLPRRVLVALTDRRLHLLEAEMSRLLPDRVRGVAQPLGAWARGQVAVTVQRTPGRAAEVTFALPGRGPARLQGLDGATPAFLEQLVEQAPPRTPSPVA